MILNIILSWFGLARSSLLEAEMRKATNNYHAYTTLRTYLVYLKQQTPHQVVKEEIYERLDKAATYFYLDLSD